MQVCILISLIRIKPDWNVKLKAWIYEKSGDLIRIKPDWNVKLYLIL